MLNNQLITRLTNKHPIIMKEFSNIVEIYLVSQIAQVLQTDIVVKENQKPIIVHAADFDITPSNRKTKAGTLSEVNLSIYIDKLSKTDASILSIERSVVLLFKTSAYQNVVMGSLHYPARVIMSRHLNSEVLNVVSTQPTPHAL